MDQLERLKKEYNHYIDRNKKAEEYFKNHTVAECMKYIPLFNEITKSLSRLKYQIEEIIERELTYEETFNGFRG